MLRPQIRSFRLCALSVLAMLYGSPRFRHAQRSRPVALVDQGVVFECFRGKTRKKGRQAPSFCWTMPLNGVWSEGLAQRLWHVWHSVLGKDATFLVPALSPFRAPVDKATGFAKVPMSAGAFVANLRLVLSFTPAEWPERPIAPPNNVLLAAIPDHCLPAYGTPS